MELAFDVVMSADNGQEFARLLVSSDRELRRYISVFLQRRDDVEEVLQSTATVLWEQFDAYDRNREFLPWAMRFAYFEVLNFRKMHARSRLIYGSEAMARIMETHEEIREDLEDRRRHLGDCLQSLTDNDRLLVNRRYGEASTILELAKSMDRTVKSLYRRLDRVRELLTKCVDEKIASSEG